MASPFCLLASALPYAGRVDTVKRAREAQAALEAAEAATDRARHNRDRLVVILCRRTPVPVVAAWVGLSRQTVTNIVARWGR